MRVPFPAFPAQCQLADLPFAPAGTTRADGGGAALASSSSSLAPAATTNLQPVPFATGDGAMAVGSLAIKEEEPAAAAAASEASEVTLSTIDPDTLWRTCLSFCHCFSDNCF